MTRTSRSFFAICAIAIVPLSAAGVQGATPAEPVAEHLVVLWPAAARLLVKQESKTPALTAVKDPFGLEAWRSVEIPAEPGAALTWTADVAHPGEYDVYVEIQITASNPNGHPVVGPLGFRLAADGPVLQATVYRTDYAHVAYPYEYPSSQQLYSIAASQYILERVGHIRLESGQRLLKMGSFTGMNGMSAHVGAVCLRPTTDDKPNYRGVRQAIDEGRQWMAPDRLGLPKIIDSHMVLQRDVAVPIWGRARPGATVAVTFLGQKKETRSDARGFWRLTLDPMKAGGPFEMVIRSEDKTITLTDVLVGEVWVGAGQSNMTWAVGNDREMKGMCDAATIGFVGKGDYPLIRVSSFAHHLVTAHEGGWMPMSEVKTSFLPSLMSCMAILLNRGEHVPVGIIVRAIGGVPGSVWMDRDTFENAPDIRDGLSVYEKNAYPPQYETYLKDLSAWSVKAAAAKAKGEKEPPKPYPPTPAGTFWADGSGLYMSLLAPVEPYAVRGIVWDQAESGTGVPQVTQQDLLAALVAGWRNAWGSPQLPFLYMQKVEYGTGPGLASFNKRMSQVANCWMVSNEGLIHVTHPPDKLDYAKRLFRVMMDHVYRDGQLPDKR